MTDILYSIDLWLFRAGNRALANPVFDILLPILTNEKYMVPLYALLLLGLLWKGGRNGRLCVVIVLLAVVLVNWFNSEVVKEMVGRIRPCSAVSDVRLLVPCGAGKSFPSTHAVNNAAAAVVFSFFYRRYARYIFAYAGLIGFTRVYCGVHYPSDILGGFLEGGITALLVLVLWHTVATRIPLPARLPSLALPVSPFAVFGGGKKSPENPHVEP